MSEALLYRIRGYMGDLSDHQCCLVPRKDLEAVYELAIEQLEFDESAWISEEEVKQIERAAKDVEDDLNEQLKNALEAYDAQCDRAEMLQEMVDAFIDLGLRL